MVKVNKSKKGLTLLEIMLAIAIMVLTASVFFSLILVVMKSHTNVVAADDMADFALLNARAFENTIINAKDVGSGSATISVRNNKLCKGTTPLFDLEQYKVVPGGKDKWKLEFTCSVNTNGLVNYTIKLSDQATSTVSGLNKYNYIYNGSVYVPHAKSYTAVSSSSTFKFNEY